MSPLASSIRFLQTQPDRRLVELARSGHERAFEALVHRYGKELLVYCRRICAGDASPEDVLQQALLQAWMALGRGVEVQAVRPWLYRIVHNVAVSQLRRPTAETVDVDGAGSLATVELEAERRLAARDALAGLAALPELQRRVMLSTALEGRSHEEIAALLGLSHGAVRGLIYRARVALRAAAAAIIPAPVINWAARQDIGAGTGSPGVLEAIGGGGAAGVGGLLIKGTAVVATAGALATAAGLGPMQVSGHHHAGRAAARSPRAPGVEMVAARGGAVAGGGGGRSGGGHARVASAQFVSLPVAGGPARRGVGGNSGSAPSFSSTGSRSGRGSGSGSGPGPSGSGSGRGGSGGSSGGSGGSSGGGSSGGGSSGGHDGGSSGGGDGASSGGHDGGLSGGHDGGGSGGGATPGSGGSSSGGSDGGSLPGSDGGSSSGSDGGSSSGSDGGSSSGSDGGSSSGSDGGSSSGSDGGSSSGPGGGRSSTSDGGTSRTPGGD